MGHVLIRFDERLICGREKIAIQRENAMDDFFELLKTIGAGLLRVSHMFSNRFIEWRKDGKIYKEICRNSSYSA